MSLVDRIDPRDRTELLIDVVEVAFDGRGRYSEFVSDLGVAQCAAQTAGTASAWMALVGAVLKDLSDVTGDAHARRRTLAVRYGLRRAQQIGRLGALLVGLGGVATALAWAPSMLPGTVPYALGALWLLSPWGNAPTTTLVGHRVRWRRSYRVFMVTQLGANVSVLAALLAGVAG